MPYLGKSPSQGVRARYQFTPNAGTTSLSGADANGSTMTFTDGNYVDVYLNGVMLKAGVDYVTTTANTIGSLAATVASDVVDVIVYDTFSLFGGTLEGNVKVNNGTLNVTGATDLDSTLNVDGNATLGGTLGVTGVVTANAGVVVDNITIDGTEIDLSSGDFTLDVAGHISLDADDGGHVRFKDGGTQYASIYVSSSNTVIDTSGSGDLTLDVAGDITLDADGGNILFKDGGTEFLEFEQDGGGCTIRADASNTDLKFVGNDGGSTITALTLDMSEAGAATFNGDIIANKYLRLYTTDDQANQWYVYSHTDDTFRINYNGAGSDELTINTSGQALFQASGGRTTLDTNGHITSHQSLNVISAGGRITGTSSQGDMARIDLSQTTANSHGGYLAFHTANTSGTLTERMRIHTSGVASFNNGIELGSGLDATAANVLDDYEEGTWTASLTGADSAPSSSQTETGTYTKVGRLCTVEVYMNNKNTTGASGGLKVTGLPFTSNANGFGSYISYSVADYASNVINTASWVSPSTDYIIFYENVDSGIWTTTQIVAGSTKYLSLSITYPTT